MEDCSVGRSSRSSGGRGLSGRSSRGSRWLHLDRLNCDAQIWVLLVVILGELLVLLHSLWVLRRCVLHVCLSCLEILLPLLEEFLVLLT